jgi:hypothetical protein
MAIGAVVAAIVVLNALRSSHSAEIPRETDKIDEKKADSKYCVPIAFKYENGGSKWLR